ncbi:helix-turn-helix domain-containing protein [Kitasatospora sp. NPDC057542]|uniref:helix-turn-helix domain-containing protein n=1 Tax=Kitasatospora sp. NPDC057542 TaxID=3346162 RepID=UPI0036B2C778
METLYDSDRVPETDWIGAWREVTVPGTVSVQMRSLDPDRFAAKLSAVQLGDCWLAAMNYSPLALRRTPRLVRQSDPEQYQVLFIRRGHPGIELADRSALLGPGDLVVHDSARPFEAFVGPGQSRAQCLMIQVPKRLLHLPHREITSLLATPLAGTRGTGLLLSGFMTALTGDCPENSGQAARLGRVLTDLTETFLAHHLDRLAAVPGDSRERVLYLEILSFVDDHLPAEWLDPRAVADAHRISLRTLYRIFRKQDTTPAAHIRHRRLERCRLDLADPRLWQLTVHAVAARWGFPRPAEFTRAFRTAYGLTPSEWREREGDRERHALPTGRHASPSNRTDGGGTVVPERTPVVDPECASRSRD